MARIQYENVSWLYLSLINWLDVLLWLMWELPFSFPFLRRNIQLSLIWMKMDWFFQFWQLINQNLILVLFHSHWSKFQILNLGPINFHFRNISLWLYWVESLVGLKFYLLWYLRNWTNIWFYDVLRKEKILFIMFIRRRVDTFIWVMDIIMRIGLWGSVSGFYNVLIRSINNAFVEENCDVVLRRSCLVLFVC